MPWTATVGGSRTTWDTVEIRSWLTAADARVTASRQLGQPGDLIEIALDGAPVFAGQITAAWRQEQHWMLDAVPAVLVRMRNEYTEAMTGDATEAATVGERILGVPPLFDGAAAVTLRRWTTRPRPVGWAWESLLLTVAGQIAAPVAWRYDARADLMIAEPDRSSWAPVAVPKARRRGGSVTCYPAAAVQAGDVLPDGRQVISSETCVRNNLEETRVQTEPAP